MQPLELRLVLCAELVRRRGDRVRVCGGRGAARQGDRCDGGFAELCFEEEAEAGEAGGGVGGAVGMRVFEAGGEIVGVRVGVLF